MPKPSHKLRLRLIAGVPALLIIGGLAWWALGGRLPGGGREADFTAAPLSGVPIIEPSSFDGDGLALPKKLGSLRFAVIGDVGRGDAAQFDTAAEMTRWREKFDFSFVLMLGDNMYGPGTPEDYAQRFERPYKALLDAGVVFYAANGNHDPVSILTYGPYNMNGNRYYWFKKNEGTLAQRTVRFFAIDSVNLDSTQMAWLRRYMGESDSDWEICFYHHPLYTSGRYRFQSVRTRRVLEPVFVQFGADLALSGHEHFYERVTPQRGVVYFTSGAGGALRVGDIKKSDLTVTGFDTDTHFMLMEISGDELYFQAISRTGKTIDSGHFKRREHPDAPPSIK
ncbi:MAG TPA: metallophosphoesterase [Vicinamibacterales bacterium]|nr:metallophosphoesterase [Vicinamibacterales bacterium]